MLGGAIFGFTREAGTFREYKLALAEVSKRGSACSYNISMNGLLNRAEHTGSPDETERLAPFNNLFAAGTSLTTLVMLVAVLWFGWRYRNDALGFGFAGLCGIIASAITQEHHLGILAVVFLIYAIEVLRSGRGTRLRLALLFIAYLLISTRLRVPAAIASGPASLLHSYALPGCLVLFGLILELAERSRRDGYDIAQLG